MFPDRSLVLKGQRPVKQALVKTTRWVKAHPLIAKAVPTAIGFVFGDFLTQYGQHVNRKSSGPFRMDLYKTSRMLAVGALVAGPLGLAVLQLPGSSGAAIGAKVTLDQVLGCLIWQATYITIDPEYRAGAEKLARTVQDSFDGQKAELQRKFQAHMLSG